MSYNFKYTVSANLKIYANERTYIRYHKISFGTCAKPFTSIHESISSSFNTTFFTL